MALGIVGGVALGGLVHSAAAAVVAMAGAALSVVGSFALGKHWGERFGREGADGRRPRNLLECRELAQQGQRELEVELAKMEALRQRLRADLPEAKAQPVLRALDAAGEATARQLERQRVEAWQLTLGIWQNRLAPAMAVWRKADEHLAAAELQRVDLARGELHQLIGAWRAHPSADGDRGQRVLLHAERLAQAAEHLRHALLMRQAVALAGRSPGAHEAFATETLPQAGGEAIDERGLDVLRVRLALEEAQSAAEARDEALRLQSEQAAIAEVEALLSSASRPAARPLLSSGALPPSEFGGPQR
jgi:hypothetical protein